MRSLLALLCIAVTAFSQQPALVLNLLDANKPSSKPPQVEVRYLGSPLAKATIEFSSSGRNIQVQTDRKGRAVVPAAFSKPGTPIAMAVQHQEQSATATMTWPEGVRRSSRTAAIVVAVGIGLAVTYLIIYAANAGK